MTGAQKPGDVFLDRYMPGATPEQRETARQELYDFFAVLLRIATRRATEEYERTIRAKNDHAVISASGVSPPL